MDYSALAAFISPFLPLLLKTGNTSAEKIAETAAEQLETAAWVKAQSIWNKLYPKLEAKASAMEAATDVADHPEDREFQIALRVQLKKLLDQDEALCNTIANHHQAGATVIASYPIHLICFLPNSP